MQVVVLEAMARGDELVWLVKPHWRWMLYDADEFVHGSVVHSLERRGLVALCADDPHNAVITDAGRIAVASPTSPSPARPSDPRGGATA